jgi:hypothetical protein
MEYEIDDDDEYLEQTKDNNFDWFINCTPSDFCTLLLVILVKLTQFIYQDSLIMSKTVHVHIYSNLKIFV